MPIKKNKMRKTIKIRKTYKRRKTNKRKRRGGGVEELVDLNNLQGNKNSSVGKEQKLQGEIAKSLKAIDDNKKNAMFSTLGKNFQNKALPKTTGFNNFVN